MTQRERFLLTVLFTDIVASTERASELGDHAWREVLSEFHAIALREIRRFGGHEANTAGDGFLAVFDRPARAIRCAGAIREGARDLGLEVRSGIHAGEVTGEGADLSGIAVHIGARVAHEAAPGEVLVTSTVRELVTGAGFRFEDRGERALKGVPEKWRLFALQHLPAGLPARAGRWAPELTRRRIGLTAAVLGGAIALFLIVRSAANSGAPVPGAVESSAAPAIAVLPFSVHGQGFEAWREGMVDLLSTGMDGAGGVRAIDGRTVLARWQEEAGSTTEVELSRALAIARQTGARYALVGSVVAVGAEVRLMSDVYDLGNGRPLGQAQVEGSPDSVLSLVDRLAVQTLGIVLEKEPGELPEIDLASLTTSSLPALKAYLEGEVRYRRSDFPGAIEAWERAVSADSLFALAYHRLSEAYGWLGRSDRAQEDLIDHAYRLADRLPAREAVLVRARRGHYIGSLEGVRLLEEAVRRYPDDAEIWYELGDGYYHAPAALKGPDEIERAFRRAVELQPGVAPYRAHLLDLAFHRGADRLRATHEVEAYARLAPQDPRTRAARIALVLAFGDPDGRLRAWAVLDTVEPAIGRRVAEFLAHPRLAGERDSIFRKIDRRLDMRGRQEMREFRFYDVAMTRGQIRRGLGYLEDPLIGPGTRACGTLQLVSWGLPMPEEVVDGILELGPDDPTTGEPYWLVCAAELAAYRGRWEKHTEIAAFSRRERDRRLAEGDSIAAWREESILRELDAYAAWKRGRKAEALERFRGLLSDRALVPWLVLYVGLLSFEFGRLEEAERAFGALWTEPLAHLYLGRIYERMGRPAEAREAYEFFAYAWRDADPELRPLLEEARQAAIRLGGMRRD